MIILYFLLAVFATWRVTYMVQNDALPGNVLGKLRERLHILEHYGGNFDEIKPGSLRDLFSCFRCLSFWVALPFAIFIGSGVFEVILLLLAINGGAIILNAWVQRLGL